MRYFFIFFLTCLLILRTHALTSLEAEMSAEDEQWGMVQRRGTQFIVNEQQFYVSGFNAYWLMAFSADPETRGKISEVLREASAVGLNACRTWAFNDAGYRALQISPSNYDEDVFEGLDFVVKEARRHSVRLILSLSNNWDEYGGKAQYVRWGNESGLNLTTDDDFFKHPTIRRYYRAHVKTVLTRVNTLTNLMYKDDPTILAWELINEPRCPSDPSGDTLQSWIEEMASYVKSIDQNHLLEIGVEGFYGPSTPERMHLNPNTYSSQLGTDFIRNHQTPGIDFASVHIYTDSWLLNSTTGAHLVFVKSWMQEHIDDAEKVLYMPVVFAEFGVTSKDERFGMKFREAFSNTVYNTLLKSMMRGGRGGGCLMWQLFPEGIDHMDDGYAIVLSKSSSTSRMLSAYHMKLKASTPKFSWEERSEEL